jgi:PhzF family phenazine biosynthesis protein
MKRPVYVVDAFAAGPFRGNPAAVVPLEPGDSPDTAWMQQWAAEMKHSETAFVQPRADGAFDLRWFTPEVEVDLCGHATLASAHVLWESERLATDAPADFHTRGGELRARRLADGTVELDFPTAAPEPCTPPAGLAEALGLDGDVESLETTGQFFMFVVDNAEIVRKLEPDFAAMGALTDVRGCYVTAPGAGEYDIVSRCFAPRVGIDEDPVTGSMHCVLSAYWCARLGKNELQAEQASARGGTIDVKLAGDRTLLVGNAITVLRGELLL